MMFKRADLAVLALALGLLIVGYILREDAHGTAETVGRVLVPLGYICGIIAGIGPARRAKRENNRLRAALLGGDTAPAADERPAGPRAEDAHPDR
ncbi:hypothetical protein LADH09A_002985 [Micromonospora sp. LAH09]|uniref:hypothetical protein n=1 Tax=Micromonospora cabrerizensis TaxID=2911213 RepID=UPI001EE9128D|nr:hypothetical protein [Micromonospora cabrerizensis]MCG5469080.1 hypothetical protein [Micromonospora cabrerizensis]